MPFTLDSSSLAQENWGWTSFIVTWNRQTSPWTERCGPSVRNERSRRSTWCSKAATGNAPKVLITMTTGKVTVCSSWQPVQSLLDKENRQAEQEREANWLRSHQGLGQDGNSWKGCMDFKFIPSKRENVAIQDSFWYGECASGAWPRSALVQI